MVEYLTHSGYDFKQLTERRRVLDEAIGFDPNIRGIGVSLDTKQSGYHYICVNLIKEPDPVRAEEILERIRQAGLSGADIRFQTVGDHQQPKRPEPSVTIPS